MIESVVEHIGLLAGYALDRAGYVVREAVRLGGSASAAASGRLVGGIGFVEENPLLAWAMVTLVAGVLGAITVHKKGLRVVGGMLAPAGLACVLAVGSLAGMNAYFSDTETSNGNIFAARTSFLAYTVGDTSKAVSFGGPQQNRSSIWFQNDEAYPVVIEDIQLNAPGSPAFSGFLRELWASPSHAPSTEGEPRNATVGPGEKRWIWIGITTPPGGHHAYGNPVLTLTVDGSLIQVGFNKINVN